MTPSEMLDKLWPRLREGLPDTPEYLDAFLARNRADLEEIVASMLSIRRVKRGEPPQTLLDFRTYGELALRQRPRDAEADEAVIGRVIARLGKLLAKWKDDEARAFQAMRIFGEIRALSILLRDDGYGAVPLLLNRPALVLLREDGVIAVFSDTRQLHFPPATGEADLRLVPRALRKAEEGLARLRVGLAEATTEAALRSYLEALWTAARSDAAPAVIEPEAHEIPPDLRDRKWRTEANIRAIQIVHERRPEELTAEDMTALESYSGWGGLSIAAAKKLLPENLVPETFGLIHEYYTPQVIADAIAATLCPLLADVAGHDGIVRALEPSAGIGRLIRAFTPQQCLELEAGGDIKGIRWTAVEFSKVSATLLHALRPDVDLHHMPFERWVAQQGPQYQGTIGLIVSNPPYGERGAMAREDTDEFYKEKRAFAYFMRRTSDLLVPGGIAVYLIPAGFLSGNLNETLRDKMLRRHHLLGAFRLPSHDTRDRETVPGASVVMDVVFWQSRGGELTEVDPADEYIVSGGYFIKHPQHILGEEDGSFAGDDEAGTARSWRYKVTGDFKGLPPLAPRPICSACVLSPIAPREEARAVQMVARTDDGIPGDVDEELRPALELGRRVGRYFAAVGADEVDKAAQLWPELREALLDFAATFGNPWRNKALRELADRRKLVAAQQLLNAYEKGGGLSGALREVPRFEPKFSGQPNDVVAQAEALFRQQRSLTVEQLMTFHILQGGTLSTEGALATLLGAEWNLDGARWDQLLPSDAYLTGNDLWDRYDRAVARGDEQGRVQARRLPDQLDFLEFGQIVSTDEGERIGLRAAGSPGWQLIAYAGFLNGSPIAAGEFPRDGGPLWPDDDDTRTGAAIEKKIEEVFRYGRFEGLRWRGASDAWIEKWWPRFETAIAEGLARSGQREKVPVVDAEGLAIASGSELRGATILPPTRAGWQRFLELAPTSGESFTTLKDVGLGWWGRKVPQDLLSKERSLLRQLIVPRLLEDTAYRNARENADPQNARIEHDKALARVLLALFTEDAEKHGELYRRYSDDEAWRRSLHEQSFAATYPPEAKQDTAKTTTGAGAPSDPRISDDQWAKLQALFDEDSRRDRADDPEEVDRRVIDNLFLQRAAMSDALAMAGMGKRDRAQQAEQATQTAHRITVLRAEASVLRGRGYGVSLSGAPERTFNIVGRAGRVLAVRLIGPADKVVFAPDIDPETRARVEQDTSDARRIVEQIIKEENARPGRKDAEDTMLAVWRRARETGPGDGGPGGHGEGAKGPQAPAANESAQAQQPSAGEARPVGHVYQVDGGWYGDTALLNATQPLSHIGMGDFEAKLPSGTVTFIRHSDDARLPRQSGRLHVISHSAGEAALTAWIRGLVEAGRAEHVGTWAAFPPRETAPSPESAAAAEKSVAHLYQIAGETYADEPILKLLTVHPVTKVDYAVGPLTLAWIRRDDPLPEQQGRLYQLRHDDGARGIAAIIDPLLKTGALRFVGGWASWDALDDEPSHVHYRPFGKGPGALLPPGLEAIL